MKKLAPVTVTVLGRFSGKKVRWSYFANRVQRETGFTPLQIMQHINCTRFENTLRELGYLLEVRRRIDAEWSTCHGQVKWPQGVRKVAFGPPPEFLSAVMLRGLTIRLVALGKD